MNTEIQFFGKVDRNSKGGISSEMPAWYSEPQIENMEEGIKQKERTLKMGMVPPEKRPYVEEELARERQRLEDIKESKPKLTAKAKDELTAIRKELTEKIREAYPSREEEKMRFVDPHEEARRMVRPCIEGVDPKLAKECGVKVTGGKISRDGLTKIWKLTGRLLGEDNNVERIRRR